MDRRGSGGAPRRALAAAALALGLLLGPSLAGAQLYRWVDEQGNVHYAGRRDLVPERYRAQLPPGSGEPMPRLTFDGPTTTPGCILRLRGNERRHGSSRSYEHCAACQAALARLPADEARRAECFASSIHNYK